MIGPLVPPNSNIDSNTRRTLRLSVFDGVFYAMMVGLGEAYFIADGVRLRSSLTELGLLVTLPLCVGGLGPVLAYFLYGRLRRCRAIVVTAALAQSLVLAGLALCSAYDWITPGRLIFAVCCYQVVGQAAGTTWSTWIGELVPESLRAHYFARRQGWIHLFTFASLVTGGVLLHVLEPARMGAPVDDGGSGFQVIYALAAAARLISTLYQASMPEARFQQIPSLRKLFRFQRTTRGRGALRLLSFAWLLSFSVYVSAPYYGPYMLEIMHLSYFQYMLATGAQVAFKVIGLNRWGSAMDHFGTFPVYLVTLVIIGLLPLPWLWEPALWVILVAQAASGFGWGGYELTHFSMLLESSYRASRQYVFALHSILGGIAQLAGGMVGAWIFTASSSCYVTVFAISCAGRAGLSLVAPYWLLAMKTQSRVGRRRVLLRVMGFRPSGGLALRPIPVTEPAPSESR
ncbi:MAG: hypothetical protein AB7O52_16315 [Planctomycetota bacterium]